MTRRVGRPLIPSKAEGYRRALAQLDPEQVSLFNARKMASLIKDPGIIRNRLKLESEVKNAKAFLAVAEEFGSFDSYIWRFTNGRPNANRWKSLKEIPATTTESDAMSKDLKGRGFNFVGSTICYAHMQATGMVNDHLVGCFRHRECAKMQ